MKNTETETLLDRKNAFDRAVTRIKSTPELAPYETDLRYHMKYRGTEMVERARFIETASVEDIFNTDLDLPG